MLPEIVQKVRCEARLALHATLTDPKDYLWDLGLGLVFYFEMAEDNDASSKGSITIPITLGSYTVAYTAGGARERKTIQKIDTANTFQDIANLKICDDTLPRQNFKYPITGEIGLQATFENYAMLMRLHADESLVGGFEDEVQFTTLIGGSITPSIELKPKPGKLIKAEATLAAQRLDIHRVKLVFTPARNARQREMASLQKSKERARELARMRDEKNIPTRVQIVDEDGKVINPITGLPEAPKTPATKKGADRPDTKRLRTPAQPRRDSAEEIRRETLRNNERSESRAFQERFQREFERR